MEENNKLIPIANNSLVQKATISHAITNKLIAENNKQLVIEIFRKNPTLFLDLISEYYPLAINFLLEFKDILNWQLLSTNENLPWSAEFIENFKDKWDWQVLSANESLPWSNTLIDKYRFYWDWSLINSNSKINFSEALIDKFSNELLSSNLGTDYISSLSSNIYIKCPWVEFES